jgi:hypothetical protein
MSPGRRPRWRRERAVLTVHWLDVESVEFVAFDLAR